MKFELETECLILRTLNRDSAPDVCRFYQKNYDYLSAWEPNLSPHFLSVEALEKFLELDFKNMLSGTGLRYWFSFRSKPDSIIGSVNFQNIRKGAFKSCQTGYKIDESFTGLGLTSEAVKCAISSLIQDEKLHRFEAIIATDNSPSIGLAEKLGFVNEGIARQYVRINDKWTDCYMYSLLDNELK